MRALLRSLGAFVAGLLRRFYYWGFALFLDPGDVYSRLAPPNWWRPPAVPDPWPWVILAALLFWCAVLTYHELRRKHDDEFISDMNPKEMFRYLCDDAKWSEQFQDKLEWFHAVQQVVRDELRQGRRLRAMGRRDGTFDGRFVNPADFIDREFWEHGDLNWTRIIYVKYSGPIDAYDRTHEKTVVDVMLCRREVENIWPVRGWVRRKLRPTPFEPFEDPPSRPAPWLEPGSGAIPPSA